MKIIELDELKKIELNILKTFAQYCENHHLRYYLYAGTLLGAVRHKGFIPWDDDIDVVMPRPDYEQFYSMTKQERIAPHLDMSTYRISDNSICPFIKLEDNRTDGHEEFLPDSFHTAVWIDIFPLDGLPDQKIKRDDHVRKLHYLFKRLDLCTRKYVPCRDPLRHLKRYVIWKLFRKTDYKKVDQEIETLAEKYSYEKSNYIGVIAFCDGPKEVIPKEGFEKTVKLNFEGCNFNAPGTYDAYLTSLYGDYMKLPPLKQRVRRHDYICWWKDNFEGKNT